MIHRNINGIEKTGVSHRPDILKRVFITNGEVQHLTNFSQSYFEPGDSVDTHTHEGMNEVFFVESGSGVFEINNKVIQVTKGDIIVIYSGEPHKMYNNGSETLVLTYFGILTNR